MKNKRAFTLVELIVVITILAILGTIGFVSLMGYQLKARDSIRISDIRTLEKQLLLYKTTNGNNPLPDKSITITASGTTIGYQGEIGIKVLRAIRQADDVRDPFDKKYYSYFVGVNRTSVQMLVFMEDQFLTNNTSFVSQSYAAGGYINRYAKVFGSTLGILTYTDNTPIHQSGSLTNFDIVNYSGPVNYTAHFSNEKIVTGTGLTLREMIPNANCKRIKDTLQSTGDGVYTINPGGSGNIQVYCDMETDGGGWTAITRFNPSLNNSLYWNNNAGTKNSQGFYNYLNLSKKFVVNEIYVSKTQGWDGSEYVFQKVGNDLYARRGFFKDLNIKMNWSGLNTSLGDWLNLGYNNVNRFTYNSVIYPYVGHTNTGTPYFDFPFSNESSIPVSLVQGQFSNNTWGGRNYESNVVVNIFVR